MNEIVILIIFAVLLVVVAGLVTLYAAPRRAAFDQKGVTVDAEVTNLDTRRIKGVIFNSTGYFVGYTYFVDQVRQAGNYRISEYAFNQLKVGGTIQVRYLPDHPEISKPALTYLDSDVERSDNLSCLTYAGGVAAILIIVSLIYLAQGKPTTPGAASTSVMQTDLKEIHTALDTKIPNWQQAATVRMVRLSASDAGFNANTDMREVDYGLCRTKNGDHFYLYVMHLVTTSETPDASWFAEAYIYLPDVTKVADCVPEGWTVLGDKIIEGDWHQVYLSYPPQLPFYKLTATAKAAGDR
jgi:hypothetical protein